MDMQQREYLRLRIREATEKGYAEVGIGGVFDASYPESKTRRGRVQWGAGYVQR